MSTGTGYLPITPAAYERPRPPASTSRIRAPTTGVLQMNPKTTDKSRASGSATSSRSATSSTRSSRRSGPARRRQGRGSTSREARRRAARDVRESQQGLKRAAPRADTGHRLPQRGAGARTKRRQSPPVAIRKARHLQEPGGCPRRWSRPSWRHPSSSSSGRPARRLLQIGSSEDAFGTSAEFVGLDNFASPLRDRPTWPRSGPPRCSASPARAWRCRCCWR